MKTRRVLQFLTVLEIERHRKKSKNFGCREKTQLHFDQKSTIRTPEQASLPLVSLLFRPSAMSSVGQLGTLC